ncbi:Cytochrome P450 4d2 [Lucilia cuprina]|uniref:Cytochrome P450 4d2 n=1 Tax=Lucilia cuprina TaxID=7375 RepID=A0A0L0BXP5_LUCCU|nr:Cytochrome P450 4d2 [Lucilia cuprina]KNC24818.1 Cytochrome P450 4d2 [Lucilia cuprina]
MLFPLILIILTIFILADYLKKKRIKKILKAGGASDSKFTLPLLGDILLFIGLNVKNLTQFLMNCQLKYGKIYCLWSLNKCILVLQDANYIQHILTSPNLVKKPFFYNQLSLWLGDGLLLSSGSKWQKRRKIIIPTFNYKLLEQFVKIFDQQAHDMIHQLHDKANGKQAINIVPIICSTALNILLKTTMGVEMCKHSSDGLTFLAALESIFHIAGSRFLKPLEHFDFTFKLLSYKTYTKLLSNVQIIHKFTEKLINERRAELTTTIKDKYLDQNANEYEEMGIKKNRTFLDILLQSTIDGKPLTNEDIHEEVNNFTFGGHDTTTCAISFILYLLSRHPEVQQKVYEEILSIIGPDKNKSVVMGELLKLKYLECVIKEALRLYPPAPIIGRTTEEDFKIGNNIIPRGTNIIILIYMMCRDPDYFPRPNDFIPERFSAENIEKIHPFAFLPFSWGPRNCIGQKFAILEIKSIVSCLLRHFEFLPLGPDVVRMVTVVMRSSTGINMALKVRK